MEKSFFHSMKARAGFIRIIVIFFTLSLPACNSGANSTPTLTPVTVQLSFSHQAEFAGFYAADQLGYYAEEGLAVSFLEGGPEVDFIAPVVGGAAHFGVAQPADVILARAAGKMVRSIAAIYRYSPIVFFTLAESGIIRPQDFIGKKIRSTTSTDKTLQAMMTMQGIHPDQYEIVNLPSDIEEFVSGEVPVWGGYLNVFVLEVQRAGHKINIIYPDDYRIHFYGDVLVTRDDLIAEHADLVLRFTRATLKGWTFVVENPGTTGAFVQKYEPEADADLESARMVASVPLVSTGEDFVGWMEPGTWEGIQQTLSEQGALTNPLDLTQVYTLQFLEEIYLK
jgi:NitT/TauT family transport system substrate-binding protein